MPNRPASTVPQTPRTGFRLGYANGFAQGREEGRSGFADPFPGTSIIIPTFNQLDYLKACLASIRRHTSTPYELIVIDNGSTDGTTRYLRANAGSLRYKIMSRNLGFAGGVNQGLMMARGETVLLLNNDTVVTKHWLDNMLACLDSDPQVGLVGPVTNYISGEQLVPTRYRTLKQMHAFAAANNQPDSSRWRRTNRLTGLCVLMKRGVLERIGYFDEGFRIGNCEDDDYGFRVRLTGLDLVIAGDAFIHHYGSTSIKSIKRSVFQAIFRRNREYYASKWGDAEALRQEALDRQPSGGEERGMTDFYPTHVVVKGANGALYWLEQGVLHPLQAGDGVVLVDLPATRLAQLDLRRFSPGEPLSPAEAVRRMEGAMAGRSPDGRLPEGALLQTEDGERYQLQQGRLRRIANGLAFTCWFPEWTAHGITASERLEYAEGVPIIAPVVLESPIL